MLIFPPEKVLQISCQKICIIKKPFLPLLNKNKHAMKTTINNNLRVYHVVTFLGHQAFCNIEDLNRVVKELDARAGYFKVYHFWDNKPKKLSRKVLDQMFEGSQLKREFEY